MRKQKVVRIGNIKIKKKEITKQNKRTKTTHKSCNIKILKKKKKKNKKEKQS